jgi:hypothetical protein
MTKRLFRQSRFIFSDGELFVKCMIALGIFCFLAFFADRDGFEGDDLNSTLPMLTLAAAKSGDLLIYRYNWQPLSYELGALLYSISRSANAIFLIPSAAASLTVFMLIGLMRHHIGTFTVLLLIALAPELVFSGLYYNSSIVGLPFVTFAIVLCRRSNAASLFGAGIFLCLSILVRIDYVLTAPLIALMAVDSRRSFSAAFVVVISCLLGLTLAYLIGILNPLSVINEYREASGEIARRSSQPGWDSRVKTMVLTTMFSPAGWVLTAVAAVTLVFDSARQRSKPIMLWVVMAAPMILLVIAPLSAKYILPILPFWFLVMAKFLNSLKHSLLPSVKWTLKWGLAAVVLAQTILSFSPQRNVPFVAFSIEPSYTIRTHDGPRAYGGIAWLISGMAAWTASPETQSQARLISQRVLQGENLIAFGDESFFDKGGVAWRRAAILLAHHGCRPEAKGEGLVVWYECNGVFITVTKKLEKAQALLLPGIIYSVIDLR